MKQKQLSSNTKIKKKCTSVFFCFFFAHFKNQTTRTDDELGFIVQQKINQVLEYSNKDGKKIKQLLSYLTYRWENNVTPHSMGRENAIVSV